MKKTFNRIVSMTFYVLILLAMCFYPDPAYALSPDQSQLVRLTQQTVNWVPNAQVEIDGMAISGSFALVAWDDGANSGGELLASNASGTWTKIASTGGAYSATELTQYDSVPAAVSSFLISNLRPLPPAGGPSMNASGTSAHPVYHEKCYPEPPAKPYACQGNDPSGVLAYKTSAVAPTTPNSAVVADITVSFGTAIVSLVDPNGTVLQSVTLSSGQTGGVGYIDDLAPAGVYTVTIQGTFNSSFDPGGVLQNTTYSTDAVWSGTLSW